MQIVYQQNGHEVLYPTKETANESDQGRPRKQRLGRAHLVHFQDSCRPIGLLGTADIFHPCKLYTTKKPTAGPIQCKKPRVNRTRDGRAMSDQSFHLIEF